MYGFTMEPAEAIRKLREWGLDLFVGEDGVVHGRFRERGRTMTLEMQDVADALQARNEEAVAILRAEAVTEYKGLTIEQATALGEKIKAGELELEGTVHYHRKTGLVDMAVKGGQAHG